MTVEQINFMCREFVQYRFAINDKRFRSMELGDEKLCKILKSASSYVFT